MFINKMGASCRLFNHPHVLTYDMYILSDENEYVFMSRFPYYFLMFGFFV